MDKMLRVDTVCGQVALVLPDRVLSLERNHAVMLAQLILTAVSSIDAEAQMWVQQGDQAPEFMRHHQDRVTPGTEGGQG